MADIVDKAQRSRMMAAITGKNTKPERLVRSHLHRAGLRFRLHARGLPGRPDIVLPRWHAVVFVHGCFWHRHGGCRRATTPSSNRRFWNRKFRENVERDRRNLTVLRRAGWRVYVIWECRTGVRSLDLLVRRIKQ
jgi:DNA mismatch endonuclease (patch repair protein)